MSTAQAPAAAAGRPAGEEDAVIHTADLTKVYPGGVTALVLNVVMPQPRARA